MRCYLVKFQSCLLGQLCNFEFYKISSHISWKLCYQGTWIFFCKEYPYGLIYKINFKFLDRTVSEKNARLSCKISMLLITTIVQLWILQVIIAFFSKTVPPRNMKFFCKEYPYGFIYKINFKFLICTVSDKNEMLTCKISKLFIRTIGQLWIFSRYHRNFLEICATEEHEIFFCKEYAYGLIYKINFKFLGRTVLEKNEIFFCKEYAYGLIYKINFKFLGRTVLEKNTMLTCRISKLFIRTIVQLWILEVIIAFFSETIWPRNMKVFLQKVSIWVNIQNKFQVPRFNSIGEKWDANL